MRREIVRASLLVLLLGATLHGFLAMGPEDGEKTEATFVHHPVGVEDP